MSTNNNIQKQPELSAFGTKATSQGRRAISAFGGEADIHWLVAFSIEADQSRVRQPVLE
jgi:hypothetical protein